MGLGVKVGLGSHESTFGRNFEYSALGGFSGFTRYHNFFICGFWGYSGGPLNSDKIINGFTWSKGQPANAVIYSYSIGFQRKMNSNFSLFGSIGLASGKMHLNKEDSNYIVNRAQFKSTTKPTLGIGLAWHINSTSNKYDEGMGSLRISYDYHSFDFKYFEGSLHTLSLSFLLCFDIYRNVASFEKADKECFTK